MGKKIFAVVQKDEDDRSYEYFYSTRCIEQTEKCIYRVDTFRVRNHVLTRPYLYTLNLLEE